MPVAALLPECDFTVCDINPYALRLLKERALAAGVSNIDRFVCADAAAFPDAEPFDVCVAMHACGAATDHAQAAALKRGASYAMVPCCFGKIKAPSATAAAQRRAGRKQRQKQRQQQFRQQRRKQLLQEEEEEEEEGGTTGEERATGQGLSSSSS